MLFSDLVAKHEKLVIESLEWNSSLPFVVSEPYLLLDESPSLFCAKFKQEDLFKLVSLKGPLFSLQKWYFCPQKFTPDGDFKTSKEGWPKLQAAIYQLAHQHGYSFCTNGFSNKVHNALALLCTRHRMVRRSAALEPSDYRTTFIRSDKRVGSRGVIGKSMPRRSDSYKSPTLENCCKARLYLGVDQSGFFLSGKSGCGKHTGHPRPSVLLHVPINSIPDDGLRLVRTLRTAGLSLGATASAYHGQFGTIISPAQVRYMTQSISYCAHPRGTNHNSNLQLKTTSADRLLHDLCVNRHDHIVLSHQTIGDAMAVRRNNGTTLDEDLSFTKFWPDLERSSMRAFIGAQRQARKIPNAQDLFVAVMWVTKGEKEIFLKFPNIVKIDTTFGTNDRSMPLLSITGLSSTGQAFTIVRAYIPNEQAWVFRWILSHALPQLLGVESLKRVVVIMSDGDSTEISQINHLIDELCPHVHRLRCGWHLVDRGWDRLIYHIPKDPFQSKFRMFETTRRILFTWSYSWMTSICESKEEYDLSRQLFHRFLESPELMSRVGPFYLEKIRQWHSTIMSCEPNWVFHRRKSLFAREEFTNSSHESTYKEAKYGFGAVSAHMDVHQSARSLSLQAEMFYKKLKSKAEKDNTRYTGGWSSNPFLSSRITKRGAGLTEAEWNRRNDYQSMFDPVNTEFRLIVTHVTTHGESQPEENQRSGNRTFLTNFAPKFQRVRTVRIVTHGGQEILKCSCCYAERVGIPCRHQFHVLATFYDGYAPKLEDVHPYWWTTYLLHCFKRDDKGLRSPLAKNLEEIARAVAGTPFFGPAAPSNGPKLESNAPDNQQVWLQKPVRDRVTNWTRKELERILPSHGKTQVREEGGCQVEISRPIPGLSQHSVTFTQDKESSSDSEGGGEDIGEEEWSTRFDDDHRRLKKRSSRSSRSKTTYSVLSPIFKQLLAAVDKDSTNLKDCEAQLLKLVASVEEKVGNDGVEEEGVLGMPTSKRKSR
jgi:hypothetical protein